MKLIDQLAEAKILRAIEQGDLDRLQGHGEPLHLEDDAHIPEELRVGYRLLKNANFLPPELQLRRDIHSTECLLRHLEPGSERDQAKLRLQLLRERWAKCGRSLDLRAEEMAYHQQLRRRMGRRSGD